MLVDCLAAETTEYVKIDRQNKLLSLGINIVCRLYTILK